MPARTIFVPPLKQESVAPKGRNKDPAAQGCAATEGAKFSLKEEATALRAPPVQNGGCYKQPFAKRPISCLHAATLTTRAGICLLGHSCSRKNRQSIMCPARPGTSWVLCSKMSGEGWPLSSGLVQRPRTIVSPDTRLGKLYALSGQFSRDRKNRENFNSAVTQ